jgi:hypothetical protein
MSESYRSLQDEQQQATLPARAHAAGIVTVTRTVPALPASSCAFRARPCGPARLSFRWTGRAQSAEPAQRARPGDSETGRAVRARLSPCGPRQRHTSGHGRRAARPAAPARAARPGTNRSGAEPPRARGVAALAARAAPPPPPHLPALAFPVGPWSAAAARGPGAGSRAGLAGDEGVPGRARRGAADGADEGSSYGLRW